MKTTRNSSRLVLAVLAVPAVPAVLAAGAIAAGGVAGALGGLGGCAEAEPGASGAGERRAAVTGTGGAEGSTAPLAFAARARAAARARVARSWSRVLAWGHGADRVGLSPGATERMAEGPSAVAVGPGGRVYVLDRLSGRVLRVSPDAVRTVARVPVDSEDLAVGPDGTLATWSLLRARVALRAPGTGRDLGAVPVPRVLRGARGVSLGTSRQVRLHVAHQEIYRLGSPHAVASLPAVLRSKREGAWRLPEGRGVAVRRRADGRVALWVLDGHPHAPPARRHLLPGGAMAARVVGLALPGAADGSALASPGRGGVAASPVACVRLERRAVTAGPEIGVWRELLCVDVDAGAVRLRRPLPHPARGRYLPRRELAVGGRLSTARCGAAACQGTARVAFIRPLERGLEVTVWPIPVAAAPALAPALAPAPAPAAGAAKTKGGTP
jgi:hypothetical protein